jgi:hypothetical protein
MDQVTEVCLHVKDCIDRDEVDRCKQELLDRIRSLFDMICSIKDSMDIPGCTLITDDRPLKNRALFIRDCIAEMERSKRWIEGTRHVPIKRPPFVVELELHRLEKACQLLYRAIAST